MTTGCLARPTSPRIPIEKPFTSDIGYASIRTSSSRYTISITSPHQALPRTNNTHTSTPPDRKLTDLPVTRLHPSLPSAHNIDQPSKPLHRYPTKVRQEGWYHISRAVPHQPPRLSSRILHSCPTNLFQTQRPFPQRTTLRVLGKLASIISKHRKVKCICMSISRRHVTSSRILRSRSKRPSMLL